MVKVSYEQKPYRRVLMQTWGAEVYPSPSTRTKAGRDILAQDPSSPGSLGVAISEAIEDAVTTPHSKYSLGSVLNHVLLHQTVIGEETKLQLEKVGEKYPDIVIGCVGGGSNFGGLVLPFMRDKLSGAQQFRAIAVEPTACSSLLRGRYEYDYGDVAKNTPLLKMHTLGHNFIPPAIHAGGLRYHGMAPIVSLLYDLGLVEAQAYKQNEIFEAAMTFARTEGLVVAPETAHAVKAVIEEAKKCALSGEEKVIVFNCSGHGFLDLGAYDLYINQKLPDVNHNG